MASRDDAVALHRARGRASGSKSSLRPDHPAVLLTTVIAALVVLGLVMILSASSVTSFANYGSSFLFFKKQLVVAVIGLAGFVFFTRLDYQHLRGFGYVLFVVVTGLLFAVLVPGVGIVVGGSSRWLSLGPLSFQPSELAKLALILFAADVFSRKQEMSFDSFAHTALPLVPALGILAALILLQPDLGTTLVLGCIGMGLLFIAGAPLRYVSPLMLGAVGVATVAAFAEPYRRARLFAFLNPWADPFNTGYQTIQSLIAMGSGGWFGVGLGASRQKWLYIPNAHTDFIYAIIGEETGLLGTLVVLALFAFITYMGVRTARKAPDRFGMLIAAGITIWVCFQALINIGAVTAALPVTGVPLPLVSFGGTSLVILMCAMGMLVNIAWQGEMTPAERAARRKRAKPPQRGRAAAGAAAAPRRRVGASGRRSASAGAGRPVAARRSASAGTGRPVPRRRAPARTASRRRAPVRPKRPRGAR